MLFNRQGLQQKNWRMVKKGKHILFGCSLFFVVGAVNISGPQVTYAGDVSVLETVAKQEKNSVGEENSNAAISMLEKEKKTKSSSNERIEKITASETVGASTAKIEVAKKEVNKKELEDLVAKIKKADISKKTEKSAEKLNLILSSAEKTLDDLEITQEEIDKEVKALKEAFDKLEDKPKEDKKSEAKEKVESKKEEKLNFEKNTKEKQQENTTEDVARKHNEKIIKVTETVTEIHSIANQINYEFSDAEKELVKTAENLSTARNSDKNNDETIQKLLKEVIYLRNKVANRMTREHSGKRDPRNGKVIYDKDESRFRAITLTPIANRYEGSDILVNEYKKDVTYYNGDKIFSVIQVSGKRGAGEPIVRYTYGKKKGEEDPTPYYIKRVGIVNGLEQLTGAKVRIAYKDFQTGAKREVEITNRYWNVNNPDIQMAFVGTIGNGGNVRPGTYNITLGANGTNKEATITYKFTIKSQSERNTVRDLTPTYVDDVRHLTEAEKTALIEKFKAEHPDVVNRPHHIDFDRAEVSSDGATMTIYFKDGFDTKTIQTNAKNDVEAKYPNFTTLVGEPHEFYKNPRNLVKSKTNHEIPQTARVTWKTPFDFSQPGTKNAVVTVSYDNGVTKDVTTPYTVLDFIGKQDKSINQNQSGELGDARSYITLSNDTAPATDLTIRWKGGSSVDTSAQGTQRKEIEILRGNTVMKTVTIPVAIVDDIKPTITAPDSVLLTRAEGLPSNISIDAQDNARGIGLKDTNQIAVENLANPLRYNPSTKRIELSGVIPNNFQRTQATIKAVDKNGNTATKTITFNVQAQTDKYNAVANPQKQTVSYHARPDAGSSVNKNGLPAGTTYTWATTPSTTTGPGDKAGVVTVSYPDGSTDTVNVTIAVRKLSDEHEPTGTKIVRNQNVPVTNNDLKAAVNVNNNGNSKVKSVTPVSSISTANAGMQTIRATVTYLDNTTDFVDIPLEVKDVTAPTIQTPSDRQNWDLIALDRTLPSIKVATTDNPGGSGVKSTTVTGLPDFLVYDNATKTIKFKNGVQEVTKLPVGQDSKTYTVSIQVTDNADNPSQRQFTITVKSMTTKYNATPNVQKQTVSYGTTPDAGTSINKNGLPAGTTYTWATTPSTTTEPGEKAGVVTVTYPDGSKDTVNVTVNVRRLADEYAPTATKITKNQNESVSNEELKAAVTISNNGNSKVKSVTPIGTISTTNAGTTTIKATVTYLDNTTDPVDIPLEVKDVTAPTIQSPSDRQNWDLIALDRTLPSITVTSVDNNGGTGVKSTTVTGLPDFLVYDNATKTIKFKNGVQEVTKLPVGQDSKTYTVSIQVTDNADNPSQRQFTITVKSMTTKYNATPNAQKQTVNYGATPDAGTSINKNGLPTGTTYTWVTTPSTTTGPGEKAGVVTVTYPDGSKDTVNVTVNVRALNGEFDPQPKPQTVDNGTVPNAEDSVDKTGLPEGTRVTWKETPVVNTPGSHPTVALVTYPDGTVDEVTVPITVKEQKDTFNPTAKQPNQKAKHGSEPSAEGSINTDGLPSGTRYTWVEKPDTKTTPGNKPGKVLITYPDNSTEEVTVTVEVTPQKDDYDPQPKPQTVDNGTVPNAEDSVDKTGLPEGTRVTWKETPVVNTPGSHPTVALVTYPDGTVDEVSVTIVVRQSSEKGVPETNDEKPEFSGGVNPSDSPSLNIPEYTDPIGTSGTDGNGNTIEPPKVDIPEYTDPIGTSGTDGNGNTIEPPKVDIPEYTGPIGTSGTDGNGNTIEPPIVNLPEFSGGVNGELPEPTQLPKVKLIITKWIDENGNELKPADAKYPKVLGELNEAFDHGEIKGYVFVRTEVDNSGEVVTHIFRKVSNTVITSSNHVEESTKFNKTLKAPKRLANTGQSQNNSELAGLGLAIVGLFAAIKRRKNEEE